MPDDPEVAGKRAEFAEFLEANPYSRIGRIERPIAQIVIFSPWGDDSVLLHVDSPSLALSAAVNNVILPERFSALYHKQERQLEFIYTAFPLRPELVGRRFEFVHAGTQHQCSYGACSDQLLILGDHFRPGDRSSSSDHRNLHLIQAYVWKNKGLPQFRDMGLVRPSSFWVDNVDWSEAHALSLAQHLNFYMTYYDNKSPVILLHTPKEEGIRAQPQIQFRHGRFPKRIRSRRVDDNLFHFWHYARGEDSARRFLYNYQILEFAAHYVLDEGIRKNVIRTIEAPHALDDVDVTANAIIDAVSASKMHDTAKVEALLHRAVDPKIVWTEVHRNLDFFRHPTRFEGGFEIRPLALTAEEFERQWAGVFAKALRDIRNGLSHAKESRMETSILPTKSNLSKLRNWSTLASVAATEAMIYRNDA